MAGREFALAVFLALVSPAMADDAASSTNAAPTGTTTPDANSHKASPIGDVGFGSDNATKDDGSYQVRIGELYAPNGEAYIIPFLIPTVGAGQHVATAHLRFQLFGIAADAGGGLANADLYAIGVRDSNKPIKGDYYQGSKQDFKAAALIQENFLTPTSKVRTDAEKGPFVETNADGDKALAKFLDAAFTKPGNAGKYVILRISYNADPIPDGNNAYMVLTTGATGDNEAPVLTYTLK
ncbi:MAG TPA: hypothetical protein VHY09_15725 [Candidatus Methylacidiphilales bacterium]|jgi:hypothetical protein|nr:hypothetical protein [Candidatus Methylacidiphilales bacterium]